MEASPITVVTDHLADPREPHTLIKDDAGYYTEAPCPRCQIRGGRSDAGQCLNCGQWWR